MPRLSDYRFWLLVSTVAIALLAACSSSTTTPDDAGGAGPGAGSVSSMTGG